MQHSSVLTQVGEINVTVQVFNVSDSISLTTPDGVQISLSQGSVNSSLYKDQVALICTSYPSAVIADVDLAATALLDVALADPQSDAGRRLQTDEGTFTVTMPLSLSYTDAAGVAAGGAPCQELEASCTQWSSTWSSGSAPSIAGDSATCVLSELTTVFVHWAYPSLPDTCPEVSSMLSDRAFDLFFGDAPDCGVEWFTHEVGLGAGALMALSVLFFLIAIGLEVCFSGVWSDLSYFIKPQGHWPGKTSEKPRVIAVPSAFKQLLCKACRRSDEYVVAAKLSLEPKDAHVLMELMDGSVRVFEEQAQHTAMTAALARTPGQTAADDESVRSPAAAHFVQVALESGSDGLGITFCRVFIALQPWRNTFLFSIVSPYTSRCLVALCGVWTSFMFACIYFQVIKQAVPLEAACVLEGSNFWLDVIVGAVCALISRTLSGLLGRITTPRRFILFKGRGQYAKDAMRKWKFLDLVVRCGMLLLATCAAAVCCLYLAQVKDKDRAAFGSAVLGAVLLENLGLPFLGAILGSIVHKSCPRWPWLAPKVIAKAGGGAGYGTDSTSSMPPPDSIGKASRVTTALLGSADASASSGNSERSSRAGAGSEDVRQQQTAPTDSMGLEFLGTPTSRAVPIADLVPEAVGAPPRRSPTSRRRDSEQQKTNMSQTLEEQEHLLNQLTTMLAPLELTQREAQRISYAGETKSSPVKRPRPSGVPQAEDIASQSMPVATTAARPRRHRHRKRHRSSRHGSATEAPEAEVVRPRRSASALPAPGENASERTRRDDEDGRREGERSQRVARLEAPAGTESRSLRREGERSQRVTRHERALGTESRSMRREGDRSQRAATQEPAAGGTESRSLRRAAQAERHNEDAATERLERAPRPRTHGKHSRAAKDDAQHRVGLSSQPIGTLSTSMPLGSRDRAWTNEATLGRSQQQSEYRV